MSHGAKSQEQTCGGSRDMIPACSRCGHGGLKTAISQPPSHSHLTAFGTYIARIHAHIPALSGPASPFTPPFTATTTTCANLNFRAHACALGDCRGSCPALGTPNINTQLQGSPELWSTPACGGAATSRRGRTNPGQRVHPRTHSHVTLQSTAVNRFYSGSTSSNRGQTLPNAPGGTTGPAPGLR